MPVLQIHYMAFAYVKIMHCIEKPRSACAERGFDFAGHWMMPVSRRERCCVVPMMT